MSEVSVEEQNIIRFVDGVEGDKDLVLLGTNAEDVTNEDEVYKPDTLFILRDTSVNEKEESAHPKQLISEVMEKCTTPERVRQLLEVIKGNENAIKLYGITRIVGYYSRTTSWNKSKVGELRDRGQGIYKLEGGITNSQERMEAISAL